MSSRANSEEHELPVDDTVESEYTSEEEEVDEPSRSTVVRPRKRNSPEDSDDESDEDGASDNGNGTASDDEAASDDGKDAGSDDEYFVGGNASDEEPQQKPSKKTKGNKPLSEKEILRAQKTERKSGVVYMSRVPPFMKPIKVRQMLQKYGDIGRIYLIEEDDQRRKRRVKGGGNRKRQFTEGWIEFTNKKYAKAVASMLNNTQMGGTKKHGFYHDDLWNLKYLPKFKWRHLAEQLAGERAAKEQRLETEMGQSRRELDAYLKNVDRAQKISGIKARREAKIKSGMDVKQLEETPRNVWQRDVVVRDAGKSSMAETLASKRRKTQETNVSGILGKIF
ncbi:RNA-binding ATPase activator esf2 [Coemansia aciculifera]|uniref:18S rRNA factor 2 n=1 Tax=Coemansia aciculifera TaxID=417176 RepID=A0A9W8IMV0_9FUNG|nr:RNA-binding ATPase activator esf2 [Coemansia aciculifera]KAJ2872746.1 RNA-binding ATPase activator esf2 [Coemansia aciculifera]